MGNSAAFITLKQLESACARRGLVVNRAQFDAGETITITKDGSPICRMTAEWSDPLGAPDLAATWLLQTHWLTVEDLADASANAG
jgi:antitoxin (DNA-binding transcriptional repressor) of toxin-antitoxin stability system